jgi:hypothetical protein
MKKLLWAALIAFVVFRASHFAIRLMQARTMIQVASVAQRSDEENVRLTSRLTNDPPDVLSATNLEQWKSLIKDLKQDGFARDHWMTSMSRAGTPPVLLKHNGQTIIYKVEVINVSVLYHTTNFSGAEIYSPKMNIDETRELGLKLCSMFGFDSNKFLAWCNSVGNNWLDAPLFGINDPSHPFSYQFNVLNTYNDKQPWSIILSIP